jgi:hypothetical protein
MSPTNLNLKKLSILTLIIVPLIPSLILAIIIKSQPVGHWVTDAGNVIFLIFIIIGGTFAGILASTQLQLKRRIKGEGGFIVRISPILSIILSSAVIIAFVGLGIESMKVLSPFNAVVILFLYFPLLTIYTAILVISGKIGKFIDFLTNFCYLAYALLPLFFVIFYMLF